MHVHALLCPALCDAMTVAQTPLSVGVSRQEYWNELPFPPPGELPYPGTEPMSVASPTLASTLFTNCATWEAP